MKTLITTIAILAILFSSLDINASNDYEIKLNINIEEQKILQTMAKNHLNNSGLECNEVKHIQKYRLVNFVYYDITCKTNIGFIIYQYIERQTKVTHYLFN